MTFDLKGLADILVCPKSKSPLVLDGESLVSTDPECRLKYEIRDGIPALLVDEAVTLPVEKWSEVMKRHGRDPATGATKKSD